MWFNGLEIIEQAAFIIACIGSAFLLFKIILLILGISDFTELCFGFGRGAAIAITLQGLVAMMAVGGWITYASSRGGLIWWASLLIGLAAGFVGVAIIALMYKIMSKLEHEGTLQMENGVGKTAEVYLTIPQATNGQGKISFKLQERLIEASAITKSDNPIKTGESVKIVSYDNNLYVVEKI